MKTIEQQIQEKLKEIEEGAGVEILHAVESGSRAWGLASPDSDYDVRFVYRRAGKDYLSLEESRDVLEWQLDQVLDINGWDIKKALQQLGKGNATLFEWSNSPIVYKTTKEWEQIYRVGLGYFSEKAALCHYYGMAAHTFKEYLEGEKVRYKKYFYALRPLLAANYIEAFHTPPPVLFQDLMKLQMEPALKMAIEELLEKKKVTAEQELHPQIPVIQQFIQEEIQRQKQISSQLADDRKKDWSQLNQCFAEMIGVRWQS